MENLGFVLGKLLGSVLIGIVLEGLIYLPVDLIRTLRRRFKGQIKAKPLKAKKTFKYYFANALKYLAIGLAVTSIPYFSPVEDHTLEGLLFIAISVITIFYLYRFCASLENSSL